MMNEKMAKTLAPGVKTFRGDMTFWARQASIEFMETLAKTSAGFLVMKIFDKFMWTLQETAKWGLTPVIAEGVAAAPVLELVRPMPWIFFLPLLMTFRVFREVLSVFALLMGRERLTPQSIVTFFDNMRNTVNSLISKIHGNNPNMVTRSANPGMIARFIQNMVDRFELIFHYDAVKYANDSEKLIKKEMFPIPVPGVSQPMRPPMVNPQQPAVNNVQQAKAQPAPQGFNLPAMVGEAVNQVAKEAQKLVDGGKKANGEPKTAGKSGTDDNGKNFKKRKSSNISFQNDADKPDPTPGKA